jgi:phytoene synthase
MDVFRHCENLVRERDKDRFLATLFAPADQRRDLFALYAFNIEIASVRSKVREPLAGEVRLQYWHDLIAGGAEAGANPIGQALLEVTGRRALPCEAFLDLIEAHRFDIYEESFATFDELEVYAAKTSSALIELAMQILDDSGTAEHAVARHAGIAYGLTGLLRSLAFHASHGKLYVPHEILAAHHVASADILAGRSTPQLRAALADIREHARRHLDRIRRGIADLSNQVVPALLPVTLVPGYLARMERGDYDPFRTPIDIPQWRKQWRLWRAARDPRRIAG